MSTPLVAVLDYGIGNLRSAQKALQKVGADARLTSDAALIRDAHAAVLPGVGNFGACMQAVRAAGLEELVLERVAGTKPFLGICVGMQMLSEGSEENGWHEGFKWIEGKVKKLEIPHIYAVPHVGWNDIIIKNHIIEDEGYA